MSLADVLAQVRWQPRIGDPSVMGWLTVAAYAGATILCGLAAWRATAVDPSPAARRRRVVWAVVAVLMAILCVNKQLDLQSLLTEVGRVLARSQGWYAERHLVQRAFIGAVALAGAAFVLLAWRVRRTVPRGTLLVTGLGLLCTFILVRAASFHHVDVFIHSTVLGLRMNWVLELTAIGLVAASAWPSVRRPAAARTDGARTAMGSDPIGRSGRRVGM